MLGLGRHLGAALVAIAMIAAQVLPAWAGCHATKHAAMTVVAKVALASDVAMAGSDHHGMAHAAQLVSQSDQKISSDVSPSDQGDPSKPDLCLGNCGCACGLSGAFVLATIAMIDAPQGIALARTAASFAPSIGRIPDGPRRPPRLTA